MWKFGVDLPSEVYRTAAKYTLDGVVEQTSCPTLVLKAETDQFFRGEPEKLYEALRCPKKLVSFTEGRGRTLPRGSDAALPPATFRLDGRNLGSGVKQ